MAKKHKDEPLTHRPFAALRSEEDHALVELGYVPPASTPEQKEGVPGDKKNGKQKSANRRSQGKDKEKENIMSGQTTSRASAAKKKAASRRITKSGGDVSTLSQMGETVVDLAIEDAARPLVRGAFFAGGVIGTCNLALKAGLKVPGIS